MGSFDQMVRGAMVKYNCNKAVATWKVREALKESARQEHISMVCRDFSRGAKCSMQHARALYRILHG